MTGGLVSRLLNPDTSPMHLRTSAIIVAVRPHGEHGSVVRALTREDGLQPGYVRGGRSRAIRPVLQPGNTVLGEWRARTPEQLPALTVEPLASLGALHEEPLAAAAIAWATAATAAALPEAQPYPAVHDGLTGLLAAIAAAPAARGWVAALIRYEQLLLAELGFGLDLSTCVVTGSGEDIAFVSPRSGGAVSRAGAAGYEDRLLPIPAFLTGGGGGDWPDLFAGLAITGRFLARDVLTERRGEVLAARERLIERLKRAAG